MSFAMRLKQIASLIACLGFLACADPVPEEPPLPSCSPAIPAGKEVKAADAALPARACIEAGGAALTQGSGLTVAGFHAIGPSVLLRLDQGVPLHGMDLTLPCDLSRLPLGDNRDVTTFRDRLVVLAQFAHAPAHLALVANVTVSNAGGGQLRFHLPGHDIGPLSPAGTMGDVGLFQVALPDGVGQKVKRHFTYRAIGGVSMGGIGSSMNFFRYPDRFDAIGVMGADPGPDLTYTQGFIRDFFFGGFCTAEDEKAGRGKVGQNCPLTRQPLKGQGEVSGDFEHMPVQIGEGIGLTLKRSLFLRANRDLVRALSNWAYFNPLNPYLPPGVPDAWAQMDPLKACAAGALPVVAKGKEHGGARPFYDGRYNPGGQHNVIAFCDGGEADGKPGVYDPAKPQQDPVQIFLAVDVNGNGLRDPGEPVILQAGEPYRDVGTDGLPDAMEPGYDPVKNPDPNGDDYHYLKNPGGTENNWRYDQGEPFDDLGVDGVAGTACAQNGDAKNECVTGSPANGACFDCGEGNGKYDVNPGLARWLAHDPHTLIEKMDSARLQQLDIYYDAGIRDFFNANVSTNTLMGVLNQRGLSVRAFEGFPSLIGEPENQEYKFNATGVNFPALGRRTYVRYGNPDFTQAQVESTGDGRHVGTPTQAINRATTLFFYLLSRWPDVDRTLQEQDDARLVPKGLVFTQKNGRQSPYAMILPPGYYDPANAGESYPIVYFGHGYGMKPEDLGQSTGAIVHSFMTAPDDNKRLPKAILVFVDAVCRPGGEVQKGPLPALGDLCEEGGFYSDHPEGSYQGESLIKEMDDYLSQTYRVRAPADVEVAL